MSTWPSLQHVIGGNVREMHMNKYNRIVVSSEMIIGQVIGLGVMGEGRAVMGRHFATRVAAYQYPASAA